MTVFRFAQEIPSIPTLLPLLRSLTAAHDVQFVSFQRAQLQII
jgi:hypothetical protein